MALFAKIIEWSDDTKDTLVYKYPLKKAGRELNNKSKLIVRESQEAVFVHKGQICDIFPAGSYDLGTDIFPILSKLAGWRYGFQSPITCDIYYVNTKQFTNQKWGTSNPIIVRDPEFGMVRVKGYGSYSFKVQNVETFLKELFGTNSSFVTEDITGWLKTLVVSYITDAIGESKISILDMAGNTLEFNTIIKNNVQEKFDEIGLRLENFVVENLSLPQEVEKRIDERSGYGVLSGATDTMMKVAAADAMKEAAKNPGMGGTFMGAGVGLGAGVGVGKIFSDALNSKEEQSKTQTAAAPAAATKACPKCGASVPANSKFCPECGEKMPVAKFCPECGAKVDAGAKFCPECGKKL